MMELVGWHLLLDAEGPPPGTGTAGRAPTWAVRDYLHNMTNRLGMQKVSPIIAVETEDGACMGMVIIAESHISIHYRQGQYAVDIFSCKQFDVVAAMEYTVERFGLTRIVTQLISRSQRPAEVTSDSR